jgi:hypothetical protein
MGTLLVDVGPLDECRCNDVFEGLFKALAEEPAGAPSIWSPHDNPAIAAHVEDVTTRLQAILQAIQDAIGRFLTGDVIGELRKADAPWVRWSEDELEDARRRLRAVPPDRWTLDDYLLMVDFLIQRYLPPGVIEREADYLAVRATFAGKIQAEMQAGRARPNMPTVAQVTEFAPTEFGQIPPKVLTPVERQILRVSRARAAENISNVTEDARHRMKTIVIEHVQAQVLGMKQGQHTALKTRLFDEFGQLNRDFRRIAVTEAGECCNTGFIAAQRSGAKVKRQEAYRGACPFCKSINGQVLEVVEPSAPQKNGDTQVWVGKTNIGRSGSPRKREGGALVERHSNEMWWTAAGVQHPHCRGSWVAATVEKPPNVSDEFQAYLDALVAKARVRPPS